MVQTNEFFHSSCVNLDETHQRLAGRRFVVGRRHGPMAKMEASKSFCFDEDREEMSQIRRMKRFGNGRNQDSDVVLLLPLISRSRSHSDLEENREEVEKAIVCV